MKANELRNQFTKFFIERDHHLINSASLIPHDDSLLFVNSGMVPFKPYFLGEQKPESKRAVTVQKCVRAGDTHTEPGYFFERAATSSERSALLKTKIVGTSSAPINV